jgi:hypothetical protein
MTLGRFHAYFFQAMRIYYQLISTYRLWGMANDHQQPEDVLEESCVRLALI